MLGKSDPRVPYFVQSVLHYPEIVSIENLVESKLLKQLQDRYVPPSGELPQVSYSIAQSTIKPIIASPILLQINQALFGLDFRVAMCAINYVQHKESDLIRDELDYPYNLMRPLAGLESDTSEFLQRPFGLHVCIPISGPALIGTAANHWSERTESTDHPEINSRYIGPGSSVVWSRPIRRTGLRPVVQSSLVYLHLVYVPAFVRRDMSEHMPVIGEEASSEILDYLNGRSDLFPLRYPPSQTKI